MPEAHETPIAPDPGWRLSHQPQPRPPIAIWKVVLGAAALALSILVLDLALPLGVAGGVPYVALVLMGICFPAGRDVFLLAAIGSVLTIVGYYFSPGGGIDWVVLSNRGLAIFAIWVAALLIAQRQRIENDLRETWERYRTETAALAETTVSDAVCELEFQRFALNEHAIVGMSDAKGNITQANDKFCEISGYSREELLGQNYDILRSGEHSDATYAELWRAITNAESWHGALKYRTKSEGSYWLRTSIIPFIEAEGPPQRYISVGTDITDRIEAEERLVGASEEAETANQAKSNFLASMSHELRTPLNSVIGFADLLDLDVDNELEPERVRKYSRMIGQSGRTLLYLINDILDFAKIEADRFDLSEEPFGLSEELSNIHSTFETKALDNNVILRAETADLDFTVTGDAMRIRQVAFNLLDNAIKFSQGGEVMLRVTASALPERMLNLEIQVQDQGIGIPEDRMDSIFDAFTQSDTSISRRFGGTGLGLLISRSLARQMGGDVTVTSELDKGSTFTATFLLKSREDPEALVQPETAEKETISLGLDVLAVDDVETNLNVISTMLTRFGCRVHKARNGLEAVTWTQENKADVILMDLHMPAMDGIAAAEAIQARDGLASTPPIFAWIADVTSETMLLEAPVAWAGTIIKPTSRAALLGALKRVSGRTL